MENNSLVTTVCGALGGAIAYLHNGHWLHIDLSHQLLDISFWNSMATIAWQVVKIGTAGAVGAIGGALGKKLFQLAPHYAIRILKYTRSKLFTPKKNKS